MAEGVAYVTGAPFYVDGGRENTMRLTFAKEDGATPSPKGCAGWRVVVQQGGTGTHAVGASDVVGPAAPPSEPVEHPVHDHARHRDVAPRRAA